MTDATVIQADREAIRDEVVEQLVIDGRAKRDSLNGYQRASADDEARAFYRKVIDRYLAALTDASRASPPQVQGQTDALREAGERSYRSYRGLDPDAQPDGTREALAECAAMLEAWGPDAFPANEQGQVDFARIMTDVTAAEIRAYLAKTEQPA